MNSIDENRSNELANRIKYKYFGISDMATYYNFEEILKYLNEYSPSEKINTLAVSDICKMFCVLSFHEAKDIPAIMKDRLEKFSGKIKKIESLLADYWDIDDIEQLNNRLQEDFEQFEEIVLKMLCRYKVIYKIRSDKEVYSIVRKKIPIHYICQNEELVNKIGSYILLEAETNSAIKNDLVEIFIKEKIVEKDQLSKNYYIPKDLLDSKEKILLLLKDYIESERADINYLKIISKSSSCPFIDDELRYVAAQRYEELCNSLFGDPTTFTYEIGYLALISDSQKEPLLVNKNGNETKLSVSKETLDRSLNRGDGLLAINEIANYVDGLGMMLSPSFASDIDKLEEVLLIHNGKKFYKIGQTFHDKESKLMILTRLCEEYYLRNNTNIEKFISEFLSKRLPSLYGIDPIIFNTSTSATYYEKCKNIFPEIDSIMRQYDALVNTGHIDVKKLGFTSKPIAISNVKSFTKKRYVYINEKNKDISKILFYLFNDQSHICYINKDINAHSFAELIIFKKPKYVDFLNYQKEILDYLLEKDIVANKNGYIVFKDYTLVNILTVLHKYDAMPFCSHLPQLKDTLNLMEKNGWIEYGNTLLSKSEQDYYNYELNRSVFENGPDYRNKYVHGTASFLTEDEHHTAYCVALIIAISLCLKIEYDLIIKQFSEK